ncbi:hypothetical protein IFM47457_04387 [Aspergillus lentulus]|nr:hypothetical protein IFM47457_04387 [Aspergillus lentulus]
MRKYQPFPFHKSIIRTFFTQTQSNMPLVVPGINSDMGSDKNEWLSKLAGKKISDSTSDVNTFAKKDLPEHHRVLRPGDGMTMDHRPERLNIHLDEEDKVKDVHFG